MSNTNPPPSNPPSPAQQLRNELLTTSNRLSKNLNRSIAGLRGSFEKFTNPMTRLQESMSRMDATNREALKIGTTNKKLTDMVSKNTDVLAKGLVGNQQLQEALISNFGQGVRFQTKGLMDLTTEMIATGQNIKALGKLNSDLVLFTGNNVEAVTNLAKVNQDVSDKYGVSNDKLVSTMQSLRGTMEQASFFGSNAVESLGGIASELTGRAGGTDITGALGSLSKLLVGGLDSERAGALLGATGARQKLAAGGKLTMQDIIPILDQLESRRNSMGGGRFDLDILSKTLGLGKNETAALLNLVEISKQNMQIDENAKKTTDETYNTIENINKRALNFYDNTSMQILATLGTIAAGTVGNIADGVMGAGGLGAVMPGQKALVKAGRKFGGKGLGRIMGKLPKAGLVAGAGMAATAGINAIAPEAGDAMSNTLTGATMGASIGSFIPGLGTVIGGAVGAAIGVGLDIYDAVSETAENTKEAAEAAKEEERRKRSEEVAREMATMNFVSSYIRSRTAINEDLVPQLLEETKKIVKNGQPLPGQSLTVVQ